MRFTTTELAELEAKIANAADRALAIELARVRRAGGGGGAAAPTRSAPAPTALAVLDVAAALAELAASEDYGAAAWSTTALAFAIEGGRHPVVEQALRRAGGEPFVANDCDLSPADGATGTARSGCSPARTWAASRPSCARTR